MQAHNVIVLISTHNEKGGDPMVVSVCACRSFCSVSFIWIWAGSVFLKFCCFALRSSVDLVPRDFPLLVP